MGKVEKIRLKNEVRLSAHQISDLEDSTKRNEFLKTLELKDYNDFEGLLSRMNLTSIGKEEIVVEKCFGADFRNFHSHMEYKSQRPKTL